MRVSFPLSLYTIILVYIIAVDACSSLKRQDRDPQVRRVMSGFIRQMSEDKLLIPKECIHLVSIVGQGQNL